MRNIGATLAQRRARAMAVCMSAVKSVQPLGFPWVTADPFLFCVHHDDAYPAGNAALGPNAPLDGREIGMDFEGRDGWRMYHGDVVPGFPGHPHRGFETVTIVRRGLIDHSDSLGATARFGGGDVQWLTAGKGIVHAEMFPLVDDKGPNHLELFQIWLNLPRASKMVDPYFSMLWNERLPRVAHVDERGKKTDVVVVAGRLGDTAPLAPPPASWAARPESDVAIWTLRMDAGAVFTLPPAQPGTNRVLYPFRGRGARVDDVDVPNARAVSLRPDVAAPIAAGEEQTEFLLLQGRPIGEPVVQYGPFVMNSRAEIQEAFADYQQTRFGGWPFGSDAPVHPRDAGRFARHVDGRVETAGG